MTTETRIPLVTVEPEQPSTSTPTFRKRPAEDVMLGDLILARDQQWRVKRIQRSKSAPRIWFTCWPVRGGRPQMFTIAPREWINTYTEIVAP